MSFFESLLALLLIAILLSQVARRIAVPYPSMLAAAGLAVAVIPGAPTITFDPHVALALFIAPALVDAAFDFPMAAIRKLWRPLVVLAVGAVLVTTSAVAWVGWAFGGLPILAAITLGAIVAPPDAAAATAILNGARLPRRTVEVLKGEGLLNDATALLIFAAATTIQRSTSIDARLVGELALSAPGGILLGIVLARLYRSIVRFVSGTLGGNLLEFVNTFWVWIIAEKLHLSAVLCVVAFAMTIARSQTINESPRVRVHSFAVWGSVVFLLNVLAFMLMGMQARVIVGGMSHDRLMEAAWIAAMVVPVVLASRMLIVLGYNRLAARFQALRGDFEPSTWRQAALVGWCGMRGLVTLATAFALPRDFPARDVIVLTAFAVVIATLVLQGFTLNPLIRLLKLDSGHEREEELADARRRLADAALAALEDEHGSAVDHVRHRFTLERTVGEDAAAAGKLEAWHGLERRMLKIQRRQLTRLRDDNLVGEHSHGVLQEELDWKELALQPADAAAIEES